MNYRENGRNLTAREIKERKRAEAQERQKKHDKMRADSKKKLEAIKGKCGDSKRGLSRLQLQKPRKGKGK